MSGGHKPTARQIEVLQLMADGWTAHIGGDGKPYIKSPPPRGSDQQRVNQHTFWGLGRRGWVWAQPMGYKITDEGRRAANHLRRPAGPAEGERG